MNVFDNLRDKLSKTRNNLVNRIKETVSGKAILDSDTIERLEDILISSDLGIDLTDKIILNVRTELLEIKDRSNEATVLSVLKKQLKNIFDNDLNVATKNKEKPHVILIIGVNGVGKTTTIGKLAYNYRQEEKKVLIAACDTFRAAAGEQLEIWSARAKADILINEKTIDPSAVVFEAIEKSINGNYDILLVDTAGRLHNKSYLMDELNKLNRIITRKLGRAPDEILLILDGNSGQNSMVQTDEFLKITPITGIVITKLDGTAKGGILFQIYNKTRIPVKYIGVGEGIDDLRSFNSEEFVDAIIDIN